MKDGYNFQMAKNTKIVYLFDIQLHKQINIFNYF